MATRNVKVERPSLVMRLRIALQSMIDWIACFGGSTAITGLVLAWIINPGFTQEMYQEYVIIIVVAEATLWALWGIIEFAGPSTKTAKQVMAVIASQRSQKKAQESQEAQIHECEVSEIRAPFVPLEHSSALQ